MTAAAVGQFAKDSSTHSVTLTFTRDLTGAGSFEFDVNLAFLNKANDTQTATAAAVSKDGTTTSVNVINPHYRAGYITPPSLTGDTRAQAPDTGTLTNKFPVPNNMLYRDTNFPSTTYYAPNEPYMSIFNVIDPAGSTKNDTGRSYTLKASGALGGTASLDVNDFRFFWFKDDSNLMTATDLKNSANITTTKNSDGTVTISVPDGVSDTYLSVVVKVSTPVAGSPASPVKYIVNWKYNSTNNSSATVKDWTAMLTYQNSDSISGFIPYIAANDKTVKRGTVTGDRYQWLRDGVNASDVEDGDVSSKVIVSNDGGFDPNTNGTYTVTYAVKDSANNTVTKQVKVTVYSDVTVHYADSDGNALQGVKNQDGTAIVNPTTLSGDGKVGQNYQIPQPAVVRTSGKTYFFKGMTGATSATGTFGDAGQATDVTLSYNLDKTSVVARDVNLIAGTAYDPSLGFVSASDKAGAAVALNNVTVDGASAVDTSKAGSFQVTYLLKNSAGDTVSAVSNVKVIDNSNVIVKDSSIKQGAAWKPEDNFVSAKAADGTDVPFSKMTVTGSVDSSKPGEYDVTYALPTLTRGETASEPSHSAVAHVTVVKTMAATPQPGNGGNGSNSGNGGSNSGSNNGSNSSTSGNNVGSNGSNNSGNSGNGNSTSSNGGSTSGSNAGGTSTSGASANANSGNGSNNNPADSHNTPVSGNPAAVVPGNNANGQANASSVATKPAAGAASSQDGQSAKSANGLATTGSDVIVPIVVLMVLLAAGSALTVTVVRKRH
ncbi:bacterial Ig-like domain-containing protein [Bifidobacterium sp. ESL0745]|uniref:bacterial Ig-like domain-containing protein n=1 Tax=Bifidobacterium sp. ESL0745 TaxID=2983226 RepID=UPI0023F92797|nr:bacterial Ig-like domain-containing protein [Bifidobacterium sp. ESL0745]MDF7665918.1 DUF5011 domain-containing protein [Bifidobacterium sp. ESL0745]